MRNNNGAVLQGFQTHRYLAVSARVLDNCEFDILESAKKEEIETRFIPSLQ